MRWFDIWAASIAVDVRTSYSNLPLGRGTPLPRTTAFSLLSCIRRADSSASADPGCIADFEIFQYVYVTDDLAPRSLVSLYVLSLLFFCLRD